MSSLTDLLNPTFFMFLGIILLFVALLVVYFETKARDQNHKITSMLSLVSSLAEELNSVKIGLNNLTIMRGGMMPPASYMNHFQNSEQNNFSELKDFNEIDKLIAMMMMMMMMTMMTTMKMMKRMKRIQIQIQIQKMMKMI